MTSRILSAVCAFACAGILTACSAGFQGQSSTTSTNGAASLPSSSSGSGSTTTPSTAAQAFQNVSMDATVQALGSSSVLAVTLDKPNKQLVIHLPLASGLSGLPVGTQLSIPQLPGATLGLETVGSTTTLTLRIPLSTVMHGGSFLPEGPLPNGSSLATVGIPDGILPNLSVNLNSAGTMKASIYLGSAEVGLFMTSPVDPYLATEFPIQLANKTTIGDFSTIPAKSPYLGGFFLSVKIPDDIALIINDVL